MNYPKTFRPGGLQLTKEYLSRAELDSSSKVLDIGFGTGTSLKYISDRYNCSLFGIDISEKAIEATGILLPDAKLLCSNAEKLPFPDNFFDMVICECTINLFDSPKSVFKEIYRVLKKEPLRHGKLYISTLGINNTGSEDEIDCNGLMLIPNTKRFMLSCGFKSIEILDRKDILIQFLADIIFEYGSVEKYIETAKCTLGSHIINDCLITKECSYFVISSAV